MFEIINAIWLAVAAVLIAEDTDDNHTQTPHNNINSFCLLKSDPFDACADRWNRHDRPSAPNKVMQIHKHTYTRQQLTESQEDGVHLISWIVARTHYCSRSHSHRQISFSFTREKNGRWNDRKTIKTVCEWDRSLHPIYAQYQEHICTVPCTLTAQAHTHTPAPAAISIAI